MFFEFKFSINNDIIKRLGDVSNEYTRFSKNDTS